ncbi:short-chain dehydrogenase/reductase family oxidoreductase [Sporosarcina newyorkensis 2681]|uniref:Short-chain dehydrogenase/reductase family oxidoreductase n=1 Tax=Sporosarcina newyorkensis 2681 TaxID=1027292 RepID=F9DW78_9BACL|nr:SDR family NAD(P)-dependent oxidoreductase [Sporosarcina newyorkensis]EGQ22180.1 short-chain dehydrogenase/reductase family oxidoreductase [Sporosarcina newyorkensis 2681]
MAIIIITGASKGIGQELYKQFTESGATVYGLARTNPGRLQRMEEVDITDFGKTSNIVKTIIHRHMEEAESFTLINNAGVIDPIGMVGSLNSEEIEKAVKVNLTAPIQLINTFIATLADFPGEKKVLNISSGAGRNAYEGWSIYCTTKAGLDHFSRVVALEQQQSENPVGIVSIAPGIIDTGMQETIRSSSEEQFPHLEKFVAYKEQGQLSSAAETASKLLKFINKTNFIETETIADIRHFN